MITTTKYNQTIIMGDKDVILKGLHQAAFGTDCHVNSDLKTGKMKGFKDLREKSSYFKGEKDVKIQNFHSSSSGTQRVVTAYHEKCKITQSHLSDNHEETKLKEEKNAFKTVNTSEQGRAFYAGSYFEIAYLQIGTLGLSGYTLQGMKRKLESAKYRRPESCFVSASSEYMCPALQRLSYRENVSQELACAATLYCL